MANPEWTEPSDWHDRAPSSDDLRELAANSLAMVCVSREQAVALAELYDDFASDVHQLWLALDGLRPIFERAESNASGNPEFDFVGPGVDRARDALNLISDVDRHFAPTEWHLAYHKEWRAQAMLATKMLLDGTSQQQVAGEVWWQTRFDLDPELTRRIEARLSEAEVRA